MTEYPARVLDNIQRRGERERENLALAGRRQKEAGALIAKLEAAMPQALQRTIRTKFDAAEWMSLYRSLDESQTPEAIVPRWHTTYRIVRSEIAKQIYAHDPAALHPDVRRALEADWMFGAEQGTIQLGGEPRGWCADFTERKPKSVMLLQLPTNGLTQVAFGDASDLVISISKSDLKRHNFENVRVDVSN